MNHKGIPAAQGDSRQVTTAVSEIQFLYPSEWEVVTGLPCGPTETINTRGDHIPPVRSAKLKPLAHGVADARVVVSVYLSPEPHVSAGYIVHFQEPALRLCQRPAFDCLTLLWPSWVVTFLSPNSIPRDSGSKGEMPILPAEAATSPPQPLG